MNASELVIRVFDGSNFYVDMNGRQYQAYSGTVTISGLDHGSHRIEIFKENINAMPRYQRVYAGHVNVPHNKRVIAELDRFNALRIIRKEDMYGSSYGNPHGNGHGNGYGNSYGNGYGNSYGNSYGSNYGDPYGYNNGYGYNGYGNNSYYGNSGSYGSYGGYSYGMAPETFDALMMTLDRESFDSRKLSVASSAIAANGVTTYQLADIMSLLSFDSNRLKLAKRSYPYIADKNNAFILNDAFTFSSNADEFFRYIGAW
ncbi:MAG: hypothetical protein C0592_00480 [Marinilabiliales bacterium]|nr:MAG: hypothetical protein C0592_00480 [Marinilabiliales bacterium]